MHNSFGMAPLRAVPKVSQWHNKKGIGTVQMAQIEIRASQEGGTSQAGYTEKFDIPNRWKGRIRMQGRKNG
ncbi:MAG TPA: hypothetical protein VMH87_01975 [Pseudomonadales bacterium]|nr:hypothetical protein [Pseudomonadales bacterium]